MKAKPSASMDAEGFLKWWLTTFVVAADVEQGDLLLSHHHRQGDTIIVGLADRLDTLRLAAENVQFDELLKLAKPLASMDVRGFVDSVAS